MSAFTDTVIITDNDPANYDPEAVVVNGATADAYFSFMLGNDRYRYQSAGGAVELKIARASSRISYVSAVSFNFESLGEVKAVESAVLRIYRTSSGNTSDIAAQRLIQDWQESDQEMGYALPLHGANSHSRVAPQLSQKEDFDSVVHNGATLAVIA